MAGQKKAEQRIYRTVDGELVRENDPRGASLAYPVGEPIKPAEVEAYDRLVAGEASGHEVPGLMHDRLATAIADAQRILANNPSAAAAEAAAQTLEEAARLVDAERIPQPGNVAPAGPAEIVRQAAIGDGATVSTIGLARTSDGRLVHLGDPDAATRAYSEGDTVQESDLDAYRTLVDQGDEQPAAKGTRRAATKAAAKPADKAASKPGDK